MMAESQVHCRRDLAWVKADGLVPVLHARGDGEQGLAADEADVAGAVAADAFVVVDALDAVLEEFV